MQEKTFATPKGTIHYWANSFAPGRPTLVLLPGLTADHRLFDLQVAHFASRCNVLVWDAPGHAASRPFALDFSLADKARWLHDILQAEGVARPTIVGQSMGGYVGQMYAELFPEELSGFIALDSAPLGREYITAVELWLLKHMTGVYRHYPWSLLLRQGSKGVATSEYGQRLMLDMMLTYNGDQAYYARLAGHGYKILAEAIEANLPYELPKHSLLICGREDKAGSCVRYNRAWHAKTGVPISWIAGAGHNANTDAPDEINALIADFLEDVEPEPPAAFV